MTPEAWCLLGTSILTALALSRVLSIGRESALQNARLAEEQADSIRRQREAVISELEMARSDVVEVGE